MHAHEQWAEYSSAKAPRYYDSLFVQTVSAQGAPHVMSDGIDYAFHSQEMDMDMVLGLDSLSSPNAWDEISIKTGTLVGHRIFDLSKFRFTLNQQLIIPCNLSCQTGKDTCFVTVRKITAANK